MKVRYKSLIHIIYWIYMFNQQLYYFYIDRTYEYYWQDTFLTFSLSIINFYCIYLSLPYLIRNKNKLITFTLVIGAILIISLFRFFVNDFFWTKIIVLPPKLLMPPKEFFFIHMRMTIITSVYALLIKFAIDWFDSQKIRSEMINQTQASELALLRSQVNPHFLFNTLNNIYSLVYQKSDDAPAAVMKLSSIMRYVLYDANTDLVPLDKEVEYLRNFIELQKLRSHQHDFVEFTVTGKTSEKSISPMLLIPFVENAFKHGLKNVPHPGIIINLESNNERIIFAITNHIKRTAEPQKDKLGGIGLQNVKRRLKLLYKGRYRLTVKEENDQFKVVLVLENKHS